MSFFAALGKRFLTALEAALYPWLAAKIVAMLQKVFKKKEDPK